MPGHLIRALVSLLAFVCLLIAQTNLGVGSNRSLSWKGSADTGVVLLVDKEAWGKQNEV